MAKSIRNYDCAAKFEKIHKQLDADGKRIKLRMSDNGIGMLEDIDKKQIH